MTPPPLTNLPPVTLNLAWEADLGNGDAALREQRLGLVPVRALYELTPYGLLQRRDPILYPAGTL